MERSFLSFAKNIIKSVSENLSGKCDHAKIYATNAHKTT